MPPNFTIPGFSDTNLVPIFGGLVQFGASGIKFGSLPIKVLLVGLSSGTLTTNGEVKRCLSKEDADTLAGAGRELATMAYDFLDEVAGMGGYELYLASATSSGGAAATTVATVSGTASANGTVNVWVRGQLTSVNILNGDINTAVATKINTAMGLTPRSVVTSGVASNAVTLTVKDAGIRGNQHICYVDFTDAPGVTIALSGAGGAVATSSTTIKGRTFGGGTGTEALTTILAALQPTFHKFQAWAMNDATSLAEIELYADAKAGPTEGKKEHFVVANGGNFAAATSIAQTTLNHPRFSLKWLELNEQYPACTAAAVAAVRAVNEQGGTVNKSYDGYAYRTMKPQRFVADWVSSYAEKQAALEVGVSPLETRADGKVYEVRSITTRCLDGAVADRRTVDTSDSYCADHANERAEIIFTFEYKVANPHVAPDPADGEADRPEGVGTPSGWNGRLDALNQQMEKERILTQTLLNRPSSEYNYTANRIMTIHPVVVLPAQHQIGVLTRQLNPSPP